MTPASSPTPGKLDSDLTHRLKRLATARHRSPHLLMREAIAQYVEREEKREAFQQDGIAAWKDFEANGLHATAEEVDVWLARLEAGEDVEPPQPHA